MYRLFYVTLHYLHVEHARLHLSWHSCIFSSTHLCFPSSSEVRLVCNVCPRPIDRYMLYLVFPGNVYHDPRFPEENMFGEFSFCTPTVFTKTQSLLSYRYTDQWNVSI